MVARIVGDGESIQVQCAGLNHPRTLMGDYHAVADGFQSIRRQLDVGLFNLQKPGALIHLVPTYDGGYTNVEIRGFEEAAEEVRPYKSVVHIGGDLLDDDSAKRVFAETN
ncbi:MAG: hypothetical protein AAF265_02520 [Pseudomonadota bacterium]